MAHDDSEHDRGKHPDEVFLSPEETLLIWQHFANIGGHDKDRMVAILTLLTPILAGVIGFAYSFKDTQPEVAKVAGFAGWVTALVTAVVVLMYAGYANRNWEAADEIAETYLAHVKLKGVRHRHSVIKPLSRILKPRKLCGFGLLGWPIQKNARLLSLPHDPRKSLAPIFMIFLILSVALAVLSWDIWKGGGMLIRFV